MSKFVQFFMKPRNLFIIGFVATFVLSLLEVTRGRHLNFMIFSESTIDFWNGISPYGFGWSEKNLDFFLYMPPFSVLFAPFAFLPSWLGPFVWNLFNFSMLFWSVFALPEKYSREQKCKIFLFIFLILATTLLSFQMNVVVAYLAIFAFSLLERDRSFWAILLICISGFTKIYGIFQLGLLICYPKFWKNMAYTVLISAGLLLLPLLKLSASELIPYYQAWFDALMLHKDTRTWQTIFFIQPLFNTAPSYMTLVQLGTLAALAALLISCRKKFADFSFRAGALGILMGWMILFSNSAERHTYVIALLGYMMWYWQNVKSIEKNSSIRKVPSIDKILFWANFVLLVVMPVDLLCPVPVMIFFTSTLTLNLWVFSITWLRMCYITLIRR